MKGLKLKFRFEADGVLPKPIPPRATSSGLSTKRLQVFKQDVVQFTCQKCLDIVREPRMCRKCSQMYCKQCLDADMSCINCDDASDKKLEDYKPVEGLVMKHL